MNIDLTKILKDCPKGTKLYSTVLGEVEFEGVTDSANYPIIVKLIIGSSLHGSAVNKPN